ncbi:MAG: sugar ABC transporter substrate-binding protein [Eubacteriales bacterium]
MKKKLFALILSIVMAVTVLAGCAGTTTTTTTKAADGATTAAGATTAVKGTLKVGMAVQDLSNPVWAAICTNLEGQVKGAGGEFNYVSCESNITKQIQQVENFVSSGINILVVQPADPAGIESSLKAARDAGIKVISWDDKLENCDIAYVINNYDLGYMIGEQAAKWINEKCSGTAEVAVLDYPQLPILLERGNGIVDAIKKLAPNAKIVAQTSAINATEGQTKMETIFQSNPNVKVVACIGGGGAVGANEAAKAAGKVTADFGIFAADATDQELAAIKANEGNRMSVMITGGPAAMAEEIFGLIKKLAAGETVEKVVVRKIFPVTIDNVDQYIK